MIRATTYGKGRDNLDKALTERKSFRTSGALSGEAGPHLWSQDSGRLSGTDLERFRSDMDAITYIVRSYATPIAWVANGEVYMVTQKFSVTTSKHMGAIGKLFS